MVVPDFVVFGAIVAAIIVEGGTFTVVNSCLGYSIVSGHGVSSAFLAVDSAVKR